MLNKIKKSVRFLFGTENGILVKFSMSCFMTGVLFLIFAWKFQSSEAEQQYQIFTYMSGMIFAIWIISVSDIDSAMKVAGELLRLIIFLPIIGLSLNFCLNQSLECSDLKLFLETTLSCIGILCGIFYLTSKFVDILKFSRKIIGRFKAKLFGTVQHKNIISGIENMTAFLLAITAFGVAIQKIIESLLVVIGSFLKLTIIK